MAQDRFAATPFVTDLFQVTQAAVATLDVVVGADLGSLGWRTVQV